MAAIAQQPLPAQEETSIVLVLDSSGSMGELTQQTLVSVNTFIKEQQALSVQLGQDSSFSLITFSNSASVILDKVKLSQVKEYTDYSPAGGTALLDAISVAIHHIDAINWAELNSPIVLKKKVVIAILTDGAENCSRTISHDELKKTISTKTEQGWHFLYLGANQDAFQIAHAMGISSSGGFAPTPDGLSQAYQLMSENVSYYRVASIIPPSTEVSSSRAVSSGSVVDYNCNRNSFSQADSSQPRGPYSP